MYRSLLLFLIFSWPFSLFAQTSDRLEFEIVISDRLTAADVVTAAFQKSPDVMVVGAKLQYAKALGGRASSFFSDTPEISVQHQNDRLFSNQGLREWESSLDLPLWMPGQRKASKDQARMSEREAVAYEKLALLNVTGQVREVLWELKLAMSALKQSRQNVDLAESLLRDIDQKIAAGNLPRQDRILSQKELMSRNMERIKAEADYIHAAREYESLTGLNEMPSYFDEIVDHSDFELKAPLLALYDAKVDFMEAKYRVSKRSWSTSPRLSVGVKREAGSFFDQNIDSFGVGLSMPLGASSHMTSKRSEAALALAEMQRERALVDRQYKLQLHEAEHEIEVCEIQQPLSKEHFEMASENLRLSQKAFDMGETDLIDLLKIQEQFFSSAAQNNQIIIECGRAIARHNQVKGVALK